MRKYEKQQQNPQYCGSVKAKPLCPPCDAVENGTKKSRDIGTHTQRSFDFNIKKTKLKKREKENKYTKKSVFIRRCESYRFEKETNEKKFTKGGLKCTTLSSSNNPAKMSVIKLIHGAANNSSTSIQSTLFFDGTPKIHTIKSRNKYETRMWQGVKRTGDEIWYKEHEKWHQCAVNKEEEKGNFGGKRKKCERSWEIKTRFSENSAAI